MLQQTRVSTVIDYFARWMEEFPSIAVLARADRERVNEVWSGLGYYRRARMLHEGASFVLDKFEGRLPKDIESLRQIPGIGEYTAGAIASIAFGCPEPAVDGNVTRVLSRLHAEEEMAKSDVWATASDLAKCEDAVDEASAGDLNQALFDLGATICTPKNPQCLSCPLTALCVARKTATENGADPVSYVTRYPARRPKAKARDETVLVSVVETKSSNRLLMVKRPEGGLLAGLWEFPNIVVTGALEDAREKVRKQMEESIGLDRQIQKTDLGKVQHLFSHIRQTLFVELLIIPEEFVDSGDWFPNRQIQWVEKSDVSKLAISTQMKKVLQLRVSTKIKIHGGLRHDRASKRRRSVQLTLSEMMNKE